MAISGGNNEAVGLEPTLGGELYRSVVSKSHTAIYKQHRYFARRPHNQFRAIIEELTKPDSVILDCFAGGGVTLVEGLSADRRVISVDVNPIASMVQLGQVIETDITELEAIITDIRGDIPGDVHDWYTTTCSVCFERAHVRWFEHAYDVDCPACNRQTSLRNIDRAMTSGGGSKAGSYSCIHCNHEFRSVDRPRRSSQLVSIRLRCGHCGFSGAQEPTAIDQHAFDSVVASESALIAKHALTMPDEIIPLHWDRQAEDALARKGFEKFIDLFTARNRLVLAMLLDGLRARRDNLTFEASLSSVFVLSSLIRYVNNMTISTSQWMDGRPVAWAKHAYWTPNQFVECNPFEYLDHRVTAARKAASDRSTRFRGKNGSATPDEVLDGRADYCILRTDARHLPVGNETIDAIITDPPFGSNVQYGELTELWSVWLRDLNPFESAADNIADEILVHRKKASPSPKLIADYRQGLRAVFTECFRVLRPAGFMTFTFNNKDPQAWIAVMGAAFDAGFSLADGDIMYQPEIKAYRDTAHLRFNGELQGDVVYAFRKDHSSGSMILPPTPIESWLAQKSAELAVEMPSEESQSRRIAVHVDIITQAARSFQAGDEALADAWLNIGKRLTARGTT